MKFASFVLFLSVLGATLAPAFQQQPQTDAKKKIPVVKKTTPRKAGASVSRASAPRAGAAKTGTAKTTPAKGTAATARRRTAVSAKTTGKKGLVRSAYVPRQAQPTSDRYKEIQQALAAKGYLKSEPTGVWDADSVAAMRQFQTDRKLDPSGKLTAAALIDLGLGPKVESQTTAAAEAVSEPPKIETAPPPQP